MQDLMPVENLVRLRRKKLEPALKNKQKSPLLLPIRVVLVIYRTKEAVKKRLGGLASSLSNVESATVH